MFWLRLPPVELAGRLERPYFHVTTDLRATSDKLWCMLSTVRKYLMDGGTFLPDEWAVLLEDIADASRSAGLHPRGMPAKRIAARLQELDRKEMGYWSPDQPVLETQYALLPLEGERAQVHDLKDGFAVPHGVFSAEEVRHEAIAWAEEWMHERERQLCAAVSSDENKHDGTETMLRPLAGFTRSELVKATHKKVGSFGASTFDRIRRRSSVKASERGGRGQFRRFTSSELRALIKAVRSGPERSKLEIASFWQSLLDT